jgi:hypothetical protein
MSTKYLYEKVYARQAKKLCLLGASTKELADFFNVPEATINTWSNNHYAFHEALRMGRLDADANVAKALYKRATGFSVLEDKVFCNQLGETTVVPIRKHFAPDTNAAKFWLKNRRPADWKEMPEGDGGDSNKVVEYKVTLADGTTVNTTTK